MYFNQRELANYAQCRFNMIMHEWGLGTSEGDISLFDTPLWELSWWSWKTDKLWYFFLFCFGFLSAHLCAATLTACLVAPRSKKKKKRFRNAQVQIAVCVISCLITSQIAISRKDKSVPSRSTRFRLDCFILRLTEKVILQVVFANCVIQKWAITYTNMTQKSFWPKAPYFPASSEQVIFKW